MDNDISPTQACIDCKQVLPSTLAHFYRNSSKCRACVERQRLAREAKKAEKRRGEAGMAPRPEVPSGACLIPVNGRRPDAEGKNITTVVAWAIVSAEDFDRLSCHVWHFHAKYARRTQPKVDANGLAMHREVLNAQKGQLVDHINGNTLDNRRCNLRLADFSGNVRNASVRNTNKQGYKGVGKTANRTRPYRARIRIGVEDIFLGCFKTPEEAARAYDLAAVKHFGEFARLNFPTE